jgi:hypothetical protein
MDNAQNCDYAVDNVDLFAVMDSGGEELITLIRNQTVKLKCLFFKPFKRTGSNFLS